MMAAGVNPVFLRNKDIPDATPEHPATVIEICLAAERTAGQGSVVGAQTINGLWRIYPTTKEARSTLLVRGLRLRETVIQVNDINPYILRNDSGEEKPSTKVWVDNVPLSVADTEIEHALTKSGCELRSSVRMERARDKDNKLSRFLTGRRFVFITVPAVPLEKSLKVSFFNAKVYHKEQKLVKKRVVCSNCLENDHHASQCDKDVVCRACKQSGHKRGDPSCTVTESAHIVSEQPSREAGAVGEERGVRESASENGVGEREKPKKNGGGKQDRGRAAVRQGDIRASLQHSGSLRNRSHTPKRPRSSETSSPETSGSKQPKHDGRRSQDSPSSPHPDDGEERG